MHSNPQLWLAWAEGTIDDDTAQAAAERLTQEAAHAARRRQEAAITRKARVSTTTARAARDKAFGYGRCVPLDRNAKVRVMVLARALNRRTEPGKAYGVVTAKALAVLNALLWGFHNAASGKCFPSYEALAKRAGCARSTVAEAIRALERAGVLTWVNRIKRVREYVPGLFGKASAWRWAVQRSSNSYSFNDPASSKSDFQTRTPAQGLNKERIANNVPPAAPRSRRAAQWGPLAQPISPEKTTTPTFTNSV